jgi:hypothetical protein
MRFLRNWNDADFWRWQWERISFGTKLLLVVGVGLICGLGGFTAAKGLAEAADTAAAFAPPTGQVVTVQRILVGEDDGDTVVRTVTLPAKIRDRVITDSQTQTVTRTEARPVTVTHAVTGSTKTVTDRVAGRSVTVKGPVRTVTHLLTVTTPGQGVTVAGPIQTVTSRGRTVTEPVRITVTQPERTVTETATDTVTVTVTELAAEHAEPPEPPKPTKPPKPPKP